MKLLHVFLPILELAAFAAGQDVMEAKTDAVTVQFMGSSGGIKIFPKGDPTSFIMVQQDKLEEVDATGKATANSLNMAGQNSWTPLKPESVGSATDYTTTFTKAKGDIKFQLVTHLTTEDVTTVDVVQCNACVDDVPGTCQDAAKNCQEADKDGQCPETFSPCTVSVTTRKDQLKFSMMVSGWPFKHSDNKLKYGLSIKSKGGGGEAKISGSAGGKTTQLDGGFIVTPTTYQIRGGATDSTKAVTVELNPGTKTTIDFTFDSFAADDVLYYDPDIGINGAGLLLPSAVVASVLSFLALLLQ